MKKAILKGILLCVIFLGAVLLFNNLSLDGRTEQTAEMNQATLPVIYIKSDDKAINVLHGYIGDVDETLIRDSITPLDMDKSITILLKQYKNDISSLDYQLNNIDNNKVIEEGTINKLTKDGAYHTASILIKEELEEGTEYALKISITPRDGLNANYYTRIKYASNLHIEEQLNFVKDFHEATFDKVKATSITRYLESKTDGVNNSLNSVNIYSSFEAITWANTKPVQETKTQYTIKEINNDITSIELKYVVSAENGKKIKEYYNVTEYYRVRWSIDRMYVLNFERKQEAIFNPKLIDTASNSFKLGIASNDASETITSKDSKKVAFVRERQLWYYDYSNTSMTKVFSFRQDNLEEARNDNDQHEIHIISMTEEGEIAFAVYGYMNRGRHEGVTGIAVYRFYPGSSSIEEITFVPTIQPFQTMKEDVTQLTYLNDDNLFYCLLDGTLHCIDTITKEVTIIAEDITSQSLVTSSDQKIVAIQDKSLDRKNTKITVMNLNTGKKNIIKAPKGKRIKNIGFVLNDFVYGSASTKNILTKENGSTIFPMDQIDIVNQSLKNITSYQKDGIFITNASVKENVIELERAKKKGKGYESIDSDYIMSKKENKNHEVVYSYRYDMDWYNQLYMKFPAFVYITQVPKQLMTKEMLTDDYRTIQVTGDDNKPTKYFVYANGQMDGSYVNVHDAIVAANEKSGVVVNSKQQYVWEKNGKAQYAGMAESIKNAKVNSPEETLLASIKMILEYENITINEAELADYNESPEVTLSRYFTDRGVNLSGCTLDDVLYFVSKGAPVIGKTNDNRYVLITSYNSYTVRYTDPLTGEAVKDSVENVEKLLESQIFFSYIR